jgi:lipopolysaccharide biosynthesis regulator YciM
MEMKRELRNIGTTIKNAALAGHLDFVAKLCERHARLTLDLANVQCELTLEALREGAIKLAGQKLAVGNNAPKNAISVGAAMEKVEIEDIDEREYQERIKAWTSRANIKKLDVK